mmetsp:Transcript_139325/g.245805  ORF Transcript_139325/g.245805 Transcript_139325/m.245805 type:complete len:241 (+) Transcript_139325:154-876(+)
MEKPRADPRGVASSADACLGVPRQDPREELRPPREDAVVDEESPPSPGTTPPSARRYRPREEAFPPVFALPFESIASSQLQRGLGPNRRQHLTPLHPHVQRRSSQELDATKLTSQVLCGFRGFAFAPARPPPKTHAPRLAMPSRSSAVPYPRAPVPRVTGPRFVARTHAERFAAFALPGPARLVRLAMRLALDSRLQCPARWQEEALPTPGPLTPSHANFGELAAAPVASVHARMPGAAD